MLGTWWGYAMAFGAFLGAHVMPIAMRGPLVAAVGRRAYLAGYSVLSVMLLGWLIAAANAAPRVMLWQPAEWQRWAVNLAMPVAVLLGVAWARGRGGAGMHPLMAAFALWAGAHLLANGELAHVLLFGFLGAFALGGMLRPTAASQGRMRIGALDVLIAAAVWAALLALHQPVIGLSPLPWG